MVTCLMLPLFEKKKLAICFCYPEFLIDEHRFTSETCQIIQTYLLTLFSLSIYPWKLSILEIPCIKGAAGKDRGTTHIHNKYKSNTYASTCKTFYKCTREDDQQKIERTQSPKVKSLCKQSSSLKTRLVLSLLSILTNSDSYSKTISNCIPKH